MSKSFETEEETIRFSQDSIASLSIEGFNLTAFASSSKKVLESIPEKDRATPIRDLHVDALPTEYVLGLGWDCTSDKYHLRVKPMPSVNTRRELLSALARSFGPLGICLPVLTFAKILFQSTSTSRTLVNSGFTPLGWDDPLPNEILTKWNMFANGLHLLSQISIDRCFQPDSSPLIDSTLTLLVFSDASLATFGAVAYLRTSCDDRDHLSFVMAK
jgi:hypothetical protein